MLRQGNKALPLTGWSTFYEILGAAAASLTGLQFVVLTLVMQSGRLPANRKNAAGMIAAFGSPTVVHLASALFVSAAMSAPWPSLLGASIPLMGTGFVGTAYVIVVGRRARRQEGYKPVFGDWLWHIALPFVAYVIVLVAGKVLPYSETPALFAVAGATLLLVYIGIHNAWDTVVYVTVDQIQPPEEEKEANNK